MKRVGLEANATLAGENFEHQRIDILGTMRRIRELAADGGLLYLTRSKLVSGSAQRLKPVAEELIDTSVQTVKGYRLRIVDGNHLPGSQKRLKPLRAFRGAALPGQSLVVYDPDLQLAVDMLPSEDAHTQERVLMRGIVQTAQPGELWMADRNFCTRPILSGLMDRDSHFLIREHGANPNQTVQGKARRIGRVPTGRCTSKR